MAKNETEKTLTIFESGESERLEAIKRLLSGKTPEEAIDHRPGRGGKQVPYVKGYYMTRQMNLVTGFRWSHEITKEDTRNDSNGNPIELGVYVIVRFWDSQGREYQHGGKGSKDVARYESDLFKMDKGRIATDEKGQKIYIHHKGDIISLFDDWKAAETDAIKKALSYFGIADDVYGKKELEVYSNEPEGKRDNKELIRKIKEITTLEKAYQILGVQSIAEVEGTIEEVLAKLKGGESDSLTLTEKVKNYDSVGI